MHRKLGQYASALKELNNSLHIYKSNKLFLMEKRDLAYTLIQIGKTYRDKGQYIKSFYYINRARKYLYQSSKISFKYSSSFYRQ